MESREMPSSYFVPFLASAMLVTGVSNILMSKYQCVRNCDGAGAGRRETFTQPVIQTAQMFVGETACWLAARGAGRLVRGRPAKPASPRGYGAVVVDGAAEDGDGDEDGGGAAPAAPLHGSPRGLLRLAVPALLDVCGTTLMNAGLLFTAPSVYQMTRGLVVLFVGCLSAAFLRRRPRPAQRLGIVGVVLGVAAVGAAGVLRADPPAGTTSEPRLPGGAGGAAYTAVGILLIAGAQVFTASQLVVEEWILAGSPLQPVDVVGYEGLSGILLTGVIMAGMYLAVGRTEAGRLGPFDVVEGWRQLTTVRPVLVSGIMVTISVGLFNLSGLAVTKHVSATSRSTIDTSRTFFIWILSLSLGWESFKWLQAAGFVLLIYSTLLFHGIFPLPTLARARSVDDEHPQHGSEADGGS